MLLDNIIAHRRLADHSKTLAVTTGLLTWTFEQEHGPDRQDPRWRGHPRPGDRLHQRRL